MQCSPLSRRNRRRTYFLTTSLAAAAGFATARSEAQHSAAPQINYSSEVRNAEGSLPQTISTKDAKLRASLAAGAGISVGVADLDADGARRYGVQHGAYARAGAGGSAHSQADAVYKGERTGFGLAKGGDAAKHRERNFGEFDAFAAARTADHLCGGRSDAAEGRSVCAALAQAGRERQSANNDAGDLDRFDQRAGDCGGGDADELGPAVRPGDGESAAQRELHRAPGCQDNFVNTPKDDDGSAPANCFEGGVCSLRSAITLANSDQAAGIIGSEVDVIELPAGTYTLSVQNNYADPEYDMNYHLNVDVSVSLVGAGCTPATGAPASCTAIINANGATTGDNARDLDGGEVNAQAAYHVYMGGIEFTGGKTTNNPGNGSYNTLGGLIDGSPYSGGGVSSPAAIAISPK